ncbi:related to Caj1p [Cephalotrichum gorgonifer]|uniref:Diphthamide biosynthesis protein 4 n=1 Tax=Cephalotrichum gorgonifer TaxID=2041049 RepID=A0AAE8STS1_9PEZI|nr:related to Caj1p [Cephalotrichum gorgonifer]
MTTDPPPQPTHYVILALTPALLTTSPNPAALIKQAYHRALLQNHPDKKRPSTSTTYTVDQISTAYRTLSSPNLRRAYDAELRSTNGAFAAAAAAENDDFRTGVENVDLDDLAHDEGEGRWYRSCRCGNERGFAFGEEDLEGAESEEEVVVGCSDCSLWLRVHFAVMDE